MNWDSVLLHVLPLVKSSITSSDFNDALDTMLIAAGPMALSTTYFPDTINVKLKRNRDWNWIGDPIFRSDVVTVLDTIRNNFRPHAGCHVAIAPVGRTLYQKWGGYLEFPNEDTVLLHVDTYTSYPDEYHRLLEFFKFWNIVHYFNPYNYALDKPIDTTLMNYVMPIDTVSGPGPLYLLNMNIATQLDDVHTYGLTGGPYQVQPGFYWPYLRLEYMGGQYVVIKSSVAGINPGDAIISVDGLTTTQWEDSLKQYYSSGNVSVLRRTMCQNLLGRQSSGVNETLVVEDSTGTNHTFTVITSVIADYYPAFFTNYHYPADSLDTINWTRLGCDIGYINIGNITDAGTDSAYLAFKDAPAIIVDLRNYPIANSGFDLLDDLLATAPAFCNLMFPDTSYPGTYYLQTQYANNYSTLPTYSGKLIILMNEQTQSAAEYDCMALSTYPGTIKVGSQTAGADGDITWFGLSADTRFGYTSLGVFYPNGDSTQRIGIVPDTFVYPTKAGIRHHNDEVLNKAIQIACTAAGVTDVKSVKTTVKAFPNPASGLLYVEVKNVQANDVSIHITDVTGRILLQQQIDAISQDIYTSLDIQPLAAGMYFVVIKSGAEQYVTKVVKE